jgi:hypothetical protein
VITTAVDLIVRIEVVGARADVENCRDALDCLAAVMAVQAEDGLYSLGSADAENDDGPSEIVANIASTKVHAVLIGTTTDRLIEIAQELATIASHAVHVPGKTTAMDERIAALVDELEASKESSAC